MRPVEFPRDLLIPRHPPASGGPLPLVHRRPPELPAGTAGSRRSTSSGARVWLAASRVAIAAVIVSPLALAEERDPASAEALFRAGREATDRDDSETALSRFKESYRLDPAVGTLLNIADREEQLGHLADAWEHYHRAADTLPLSDGRVAFVTARLAGLTARVPKLVLSLTVTAPPATDVRRDGVEVTRASFGLEIPVNPGPHLVLAYAPGREPRRYEIELAEGETRALAIEPGVPMPPTPTPGILAASHAHPPPSTLARNAGLLALGAGGVSLVASALLAWQTAVARDRVAAHCPTRTSCDDEGLRAVGAAASLQTAALASGAAGIALAGTGIVLLVLEPPRTRPTHPVSGELGFRLAF